jgi:hypothetical protein
VPAELRSVPTAADAVLHPVLAGPPRPARVLAATRAAAYVELAADHGSAGRLVAILTPAATRVPAGVLPAVDSLPLVASLRPGDEVRLGAGALVAGGLRLVPVRWWDSRVPRLPCPAQAVPPPDPHLPEHLPELPDAVGQAAWALAQALAGPASERGVRSAVSRLVGLGPGLTPAGDDVLAGALVALSAAGDLPRRTALAAAVRPLLGRTSTLSAAYLRHAAEGRAMPELARFLAAVAGGCAVGAVVEDLLRVGASSGVALASGAVLGLRAGAGRHRPTSVEVA